MYFRYIIVVLIIYLAYAAFKFFKRCKESKRIDFLNRFKSAQIALQMGPFKKSIFIMYTLSKSNTNILSLQEYQKIVRSHFLKIHKLNMNSIQDLKDLYKNPFFNFRVKELYDRYGIVIQTIDGFNFDNVVKAPSKAIASKHGKYSLSEYNYKKESQLEGVFNSTYVSENGSTEVRIAYSVKVPRDKLLKHSFSELSNKVVDTIDTRSKKEAKVYVKKCLNESFVDYADYNFEVIITDMRIS
jgi:hypothetical protein